MSLTTQDIQQIKEVVDTSIARAVEPLATKVDALDTKFDTLSTKHEVFENKIDTLDNKIDSIRNMFEEDIFAEAGRVDKIDHRLTKVEARLYRHLLENAN